MAWKEYREPAEDTAVVREKTYGKRITKGQPLGTTRAITKERIASLYAIGRSLPHRKSHENSVIQKLYEHDLGVPLSPKAQDLLHTTYHEIPPAFTF